MRYAGGKYRVAKHIAAVIAKDSKSGDRYWEPFCGACSVIMRPELDHTIKLASDIQEHLIILHQEIVNGFDGKLDITNDEYKAWRHAPDSWLKTYIGYMFAYGSHYFAGFTRGDRDFVGEGVRAILRDRPAMSKIEFKAGPYLSEPFGDVDIIYADPPYAGTTTCGDRRPFDSDEFWKWAKDKSLQGVKVFVSEYSAPEGWECTWEGKPFTGGLRRASGVPKIERLFVYKGI